MSLFRSNYFFTFFIVFIFQILFSVAYASSVEEAKKLIASNKFNEALSILSTLSAKDNADAKYELGLLYQNGKGMQANPQVANGLFREAININKHKLASMSLGLNTILGFGILQDYTAGKELLESAANKVPEAMFIVGNLKTQGIGYKKNSKGAFKWYLKAARTDFMPAMMEVYRNYRNGIGTDRDNKKAYFWIKKLVDKKYPPSYIEIASMYEQGLGVDKDLIQSHVNYNISSYYGSPAANKKLNELSNLLKYEEIVQAQKMAKNVLKSAKDK